MERHVDGFVVDDGELLHRGAGGVGPKANLASHPVRALPRDRALGQLVAQPNLELGAVEARLTAPAVGMKNSRCSFRSLSVTLSVTNVGEVKMNSSSSTCSSSLRSASNAKIENVDAAMRTFEPGVISP